MADDAGGKLSRRGLLGVGAGAAAAALALPNLACGGGGDQGNGPASGGGSDAALIPPDRRGIQLYTVRDAIGRDPSEYPTLPTGFRQVFEGLAESGHAPVEGLNQ